jgi:hypothetical protein
MEMLHRCHHEFLVENMIAARSQVDLLVFLWHLFVECFDEKAIDRLLKIVRQGAIVLRQNHRRIDGFWKVLVEHLLPVGQIPTLEYIFKLQEGLCVVQIDFFCSANEVIDRFIESKLDSKLA